MLLRATALLFAILLSASAPAQTGGVRQIDFKNFTYPWDEPPLGVPGSWRWLRQTPKGVVQLADGWRSFVESGAPAWGNPYVALRSVTYGDLDGDGYDEAAVDLVYGTGGTANWHYLYVYSAGQGTQRFIGRLRSGSRADGGLVNVAISRGLLVLDFADSERRQGDCCSLGVIRVSYLMQDGGFVELKPRQKDSVVYRIMRSMPAGPQTARATSEGKIAYTDSKGNDRVLTTSGRDSEPRLFADKSSVIFVRKTGEEGSQIFTVRTDGSGERLLFPTSRHMSDASRASFLCGSPEVSPDGAYLYFLAETPVAASALWRLNLASDQAEVIAPAVGDFGVVGQGRYRGFLIASQRSLSELDSEGVQYPEYPFFLFTAEGKKVAKVGEDVQDLDSLLEEYAAE